MKKIIILLIAAAVIAAAAVTAFLAFSPCTVDGEWELVVNPEVAKSTADEADSSQKVYYSFSKPGEYGDGTYKTFYGSGVEEGKYKLSESDGKKLINLGTGELEYKTEGVKLFGSAKLTITFPEQTDEQTGQKTEAQDYVFSQAKAPDYDKEAYSSFDADKKLNGEWATNERTLSYYPTDLTYTETVKFNDNGIMTIHYKSPDLALDRYMYYAYTTKDGTLTYSPVTDKESKNTVSYKFDSDGNLKFSDDKSNNSIFADAVFSDVTYYPPGKLPEAEEKTSAGQK